MSDIGHMDITAHRQMWKSFTRLVFGVTAGLVVLLILMAIFLV